MPPAPETSLDLRSAIEDGQVVPYFQPIVELRTGRLVGLEVLARWLHPSQGVVSPDKFIPIAESAGAIGLLSEKILEQAFAATAGMGRHLSLSVNISPLQLRDGNLPERIRSIAKAKGFPLSQVILEITETAVAGGPDGTMAVIEELKALGMRLALDDFGTGYSSLRRLQVVPFDEIKVDRSFVQSMTYRRESRKIAATVLGLGYSLGLTTVAEGVETKEQADMLFYLGCELGQGWLYGRPVPAGELPRILAANSMYATRRSKILAADMGSQLEAHPAQRLALLQAVYDGAPVGLSFLDRELRYVNMNRQLEAMSAVRSGIRLGETVQSAAPHIYAQLKKHLHRALEGEAASGIEVRAVRPDEPGKVNILLMSLQPARDETNEVIGISVAAVDITERKLVEEALHESEDHYRHTVELSPQVTWTADPQGRILSAGPRWQELTGLTLEETLDNGWLKALHPDDVPGTVEGWATAVKAGEPVDVEYRIGRGDGEWHWVRARAAPRRNPDGAIMRWYGTVEDIEDRKRTEAALRECEARLEAALRGVDGKRG
jgi:PAS domain S-box-containing protein